MIAAVVGWYRNASTHTQAFKNHLRFIDEFLERKHHFNQHAWEILDEKEALRMQAELLFVLEDIMFERAIDATDVLALLNATVAQARKRGRTKLAEQRATHLANCLTGGAGKAHKMANADNLLPPLRLVVEPKTKKVKNVL